MAADMERIKLIRIEEVRRMTKYQSDIQTLYSPKAVACIRLGRKLVRQWQNFL